MLARGRLLSHDAHALSRIASTAPSHACSRVMLQRRSLTTMTTMTTLTTARTTSRLAPAPTAPATPPRRTMFSFPAPRALDEIVHLDKLYELSPEEIRQVWLTHHSTDSAAAPPSTTTDTSSTSTFMTKQTTVATVLDRAQFERIRARATDNKFFVLPWVKNDGNSNSNPAPAYEMILLNFQSPHLLVTSLHEYKERGTSATPWAVLTFYDDLVAEKGIVLARMELLHVDVRKSDAEQWLRWITVVYDNEALSAAAAAAPDWLVVFNKKPREFDFDAFLRAFLPAPPQNATSA